MTDLQRDMESSNSVVAGPARNHRRWMAISAVTGLVFFFIAHFSRLFGELNVVSGIIQIGVNTFVFVTWLRGYRASRGRERLVAFSGVVAPLVLASTTLRRVIMPFVLQFVR